MEEPESYIDRISRLANKNEELKAQIEDLVTRYTAIESQNERYQNLLLKYSLETEEKPREARKLAKRLRMVSVLYVSVKGFDRLYKMKNPGRIIDLLDELYLALEDIAFVNNVVKIKSIGDVMLFAAGLTGENRTNPIDIVNVAIEMQRAANALKTQDGEPFWSLKMGIHTGPVMAIPSGIKNSPYNLSGESINIACRIGDASPDSTISASVMTYELIKEFFQTELIGRMPVKYKGDLGMFKINGILKDLQMTDNQYIPNQTYKTRYGLMKFMDIQEELLDYLEQKLPDDLFYHNIKHTIDVITEVELIGWAEGVSEENILLLKLAALFHDAGHVISYKDHEHYGTIMARQKLANHNFDYEQIETVCRLIMATKMPPKPKDLLEQIICDSDLDYLGRADFIPVSKTLYQELRERNLIGTWEEWNKLQLKFISKHQYFTSTAIGIREVNKQQQIDRLQELIRESSLIENGG